MSVACGLGQTICVDEYGNVWSFGHGNYGELGHGKSKDCCWVDKPKMIEGLENIKQVSCGFYHTICLDRYGSMWGFGINVYGHLGLGDKDKRYTPVKIPTFGADICIDSFSCGYNHTVCVDTNGMCYSFGLNDNGQLALGTKEQHVLTPQFISSLKGTFIVSVACKGAFSLFLDETGRVKSVGSNSSGQLGLGEEQKKIFEIQDITTLSNIIAISAGYSFSLFLSDSGQVYSCGENNDGQLGHGDQVARLTPRKITTLPYIIKIGCGYRYSMFVDTELNLWGSGSNSKGELGLGDVNHTEVPVQIPNINSVACISHSTHQTIVKQLDGVIKVFGNNNHSQLGLPRESSLNTPTILEGYSHIICCPLQSRAKSARK